MSEKNTILVVDDDKEDHLILIEYFKEAGIDHKTVHFAENGKIALDYLEGIKDDSRLPRLVILDLNMPIMNGTQTLLIMKQSFRFKNVPVVIFSTSENETEKRKCLSLGAIDYLVKPVTYDEGIEMINRFKSIID